MSLRKLAITSKMLKMSTVSTGLDSRKVTNQPIKLLRMPIHHSMSRTALSTIHLIPGIPSRTPFWAIYVRMTRIRIPVQLSRIRLIALKKLRVSAFNAGNAVVFHHLPNLFTMSRTGFSFTTCWLLLFILPIALLFSIDNCSNL